jgi:glycerol-3-phosphate dehydrogenase
MIANTKNVQDLGPRIIENLHQVELNYLCRDEWARSSDDILWRRTKLGLNATAAEVAALKVALVQNSKAEMAAG